VTSPSGSKIVFPAKTTAYLLSCTNNATTTPAQSQTTVIVSPSPGLIEVAP
jgi:hypothetical protein